MVPAELALVVAVGLFTAAVCGLGTIPFFFVEELGDRTTVLLWGFAGGVMLYASIVGFVYEGLAAGTVPQLVGGLLAGVGVVVLADRLISGYEHTPKSMSSADFRTLALIVGVLTVHSFPEGVALGVAFADLGLEGDLVLAGIAVPSLAIFITVAISVQNIPEGMAVAIPLKTHGLPNWQLFAWAVISSLPQPLGAAIAFVSVSAAREFLGIGFGFAAGAMVFLVIHDILPEALRHGRGAGLRGDGRLELVAGLVLGIGLMIPVTLATGHV